MPKKSDPFTIDLFDDDIEINPNRIKLAEDAVVLRGYASAIAVDLIKSLDSILAHSPLRQMQTPNGYPMSVRTASCGALGWVSDAQGYRYERKDPLSKQSWPPMPQNFIELANNAAKEAGFNDFTPDSCLINGYLAGAKMSLHQDKNERDFSAPIVSVSLGLPAFFLFGGNARSERPQRHRLEHGDVVVWGGSSRMKFHGIEPLIDGIHQLLGRQRINLTFRKVI
ncbi:MAG: DNA oxidative demethylase AlkB [Candidatus Saccharibacteria bacterium]|nr:DNA oxidative demethylase AlkB [Moraxellaceae bacterium]